MSSARPIRSSARNLGRILRSASFRLPLIYAVLFVLSGRRAVRHRVLDGKRLRCRPDMAAVLRTEAYQLAEVPQPQRPGRPRPADSRGA